MDVERQWQWVHLSRRRRSVLVELTPFAIRPLSVSKHFDLRDGMNFAEGRAKRPEMSIAAHPTTLEPGVANIATPSVVSRNIILRASLRGPRSFEGQSEVGDHPDRFGPVDSRNQCHDETLEREQLG